MKKNLYAISFFILSFAGSINAQDKKDILINGIFENLAVVEFFQKLESQTPFFFYYDASQLDSIRVNIVVRNEPLQTVLEKIFRNTSILFSIDSDNRVYITKGLRIVTTLPAGFFQTANESKSVYSIKDSIV